MPAQTAAKVRGCCLQPWNDYRDGLPAGGKPFRTVGPLRRAAASTGCQKSVERQLDAKDQG